MMRLVLKLGNFLRWLLRLDRSTTMSPSSYHEAGHAVAAVALGIGLKCVSAVGDRETLGRIELVYGWPHHRPGFHPDNPSHRRIAEDWILLALAGEHADAYRRGLDPEPFIRSAEWDFGHALELAGWLYPDTVDREALLKRMKDRTRDFVTEPLRWRQISAVAARLTETYELEGHLVALIMAEVAAAEPRLRK
jgi:hypothetical protein